MQGEVQGEVLEDADLPSMKRLPPRKKPAHRKKRTRTRTESGDEEDATEGSGPSKKVRAEDVIGAEQEDVLVAWFAEHPIFYDQSLRDFKDRANGSGSLK